MQRLTLKNKLGFTLVELLVVITILGVLASIVSYAMVGQQRKARDAQRKSDMQLFQKAMTSAKNDCASAAYYPFHSNSATDTSRFTAYATNLSNTNLKYLKTTIKDPKNVAPYQYQIASGPSSGASLYCGNTSGNPNTLAGSNFYVARAQLEITNDPDAVASFNRCSTVLTRLNTTASSLTFNAGNPTGTEGYFYVCGG